MKKESKDDKKESSQAEHDKWWKEVNKKVQVEDVSGSLKAGPKPVEEIPRFPVTEDTGKWPITQNDLEKLGELLRKVVFNLGAVDAKVLKSQDIPQDIRSLHINCTYPRCRWLNTNFHCPMNNKHPFEDMNAMISEYRYVLAYKVLPPEFNGVPDAGKIAPFHCYSAGGEKQHSDALMARNIIRLRILTEMGRRLRQVAFYNGALVTMSLGNGPCIVSKCADKGRCVALEPQVPCPHHDIFPCGPVTYIDYHKLARNLGWGPLQLGGNCKYFPEEVSNPKEYFNMGILLID